MFGFRFFSFSFLLCLQVFALHGYQGIISRVKDYVSSESLYSRYQLYSMTQDAQTMSDEEFISHIIENDDYYLTMIESFISKREYVGKKATVSAQIKKIAWALAELSLAGACAGGAYYLHTKDNNWKWPAAFVASVIALDGAWSVFKGITYKKRMKQKLERDKLLRRTLREITETI
jgi:hypothetical protein